MSASQSIILTLPEEGGKPAPLALEILSHGLTIHRFIVQADGQVHDIVVGPEAPQDHELQQYTNTVIGRYTNRIPVGDYTLERHGISSNFYPQPNENPRVSLHGGPRGFDAIVWNRLISSSEAELFTQAELLEISKLEQNTYSLFSLISPDGDQGYPGKLLVEALIALLPPGGEEVGLTPQGVKIGSVVIIYRAKLDEKGREVVTPVNLTQHWGFNLEASLKHESISVKNHRLTIKADKVAELDEDQLPTGIFLETEENAAHCHSGKRIGENFPDKGYDDYYRFEDLDKLPPSVYRLDEITPDTNLVESVLYPSENDLPIVELASDLSGLKLNFQTNQHGVMFYTFNFPNPDAARKIIHGGSGEPGDSYEPTSAAFLEFHNPLAAFLFPINANGQDTLLTSEEIYHNFVRCDVYFNPHL